MLGSQSIVFSYGSGYASAMFEIRVSNHASPDSWLGKMLERSKSIRKRLAERVKISPAEFEERMKAREAVYGKAPFNPIAASDKLFPGTYYLTSVDANHKRAYTRRSLQ